jgi:hypothetical protein
MFIGDTCAVDEPMTRPSDDAGGGDYKIRLTFLGLES